MRLPQVRAALDNILRVASGEVMIADLQGVKVELPVLAEHVRQRLGLRVALARRFRGVARALAAERGVPGGGRRPRPPALVGVLCVLCALCLPSVARMLEGAWAKGTTLAGAEACLGGGMSLWESWRSSSHSS